MSKCDCTYYLFYQEKWRIPAIFRQTECMGRRRNRGRPPPDEIIRPDSDSDSGVAASPPATCREEGTGRTREPARAGECRGLTRLRTCGPGRRPPCESPGENKTCPLPGERVRMTGWAGWSSYGGRNIPSRWQCSSCPSGWRPCPATVRRNRRKRYAGGPACGWIPACLPGAGD